MPIDETLQTLKQRKNTHPEGEREEQNERTNVQPRGSIHQCKRTTYRARTQELPMS